MVDDKDNPSPDPWAGIDAGGSSEPAEDFSFSLDSTGESAPEPALGDLGDLGGLEGLDGLAGVGDPDDLDDLGDLALDAAAAAACEAIDEVETEEPIFPMTSSESATADDVPVGVYSLDPPPDVAEVPADNPFATLADDGDLPEFLNPHNAPNDDSAATTDSVEEWLEEPADEPPLAVFPGDDVHEHDAETDGDGNGSTIQSSAIQIGTGQSGIVASSDVISIDEWVDGDAKSTLDLPGSDVESGIESEDEPLTAFGVPDFEAPEFAAPEFAAPEFDENAFGADELGGAVAGGALVAAAAGFDDAVAAKPAASAKKQPKRVKAAKSQGGGIGQIIGIVLGGLMALPITYAILVWGFQKDPFKFTKMVPAEVAFLLPEKFQPGYKKPAAPGSGPRLDQAASLDQLPNAAEGGAEPATEPAADGGLAAVDVKEPESVEPAAEKPAASDDLFSEQPAPKEPAAPAVPEPEPLDFSALEAAVVQAETAFDELAAVDAEDPSRKKILVGWYKNLAGVAEQLVMLETAAADSARPLDKTPEQLEGLYGKIVGNEAVITDLGKLSGMWLKSKKRPVDGAVLLATFNGGRQVGPYWSSSVTIEGAEPRNLSIISRREPTVAAGAQVLVTGVLFDGDVVWAADCRSLDKSAQPVEDLF